MSTPSAVRRILLACGIASSIVYVLTDILGGLRYPGYSFFSQAISELGARGAPSAAFVDPLFAVYNLLALLFGVGVLLEAGSQRRRLRVTGAMLIGYGAIALAAPLLLGADFLKMSQRGAGSTLSDDLPHIVLTGALVLSMLLAIGFGAFALGTRFRAYSLATLAAIIALSALTLPYAARLAAGQPTPGFGVVERLDVYALLAWIGVLSIALLRRPSHRSTSATRTSTEARVEGMVAPGFEDVRAEFERNFRERGEERRPRTNAIAHGTARD